MLIKSRNLIRLAVFCSLSVFSINMANAQIVAESDEIIETEAELNDMAFYAAEKLTLELKSSDDVFAAGERVTLTGTSGDHVYVAGKSVSFENISIQDIMAAGETVELKTGQVKDDIILAGETVTISSGVTIGGSAMLAGETVKIDTPINGELKAAGETLIINQSVTGDAHLYGERIEIGPNVEIGGNLRYRSDNLIMDPAAIVKGETIKLEPKDKADRFEKWGKKSAAAIAMSALFFFTALLLLVLAISGLFAGLIEKSGRMIEKRPLATLGTGVLFFILAPLTIILLFSTVFGIPLGLMVLACGLVACPIAIAAISYALGRFVWNRFKTSEEQVWTSLKDRWIKTLTGLAILFVIGMIPFIGFFSWLLALILGLGAVSVQGYQAWRERTPFNQPV